MEEVEAIDAAPEIYAALWVMSKKLRCLDVAGVLFNRLPPHTKEVVQEYVHLRVKDLYVLMGKVTGENKRVARLIQQTMKSTYPALRRV